MANRYTRNTVVLAKIETTYGTDPNPSGAANALLVSAPTFKLNTNNVKRDLVRPFFGASDELASTKSVENGFSVEVVGGGVAGVAPAWGPLLRMCAMSELATVGTRVDYSPLTDGQESGGLYTYRSGVRHKSLGTRGKVSLSMKEGEIPKFTFQMIGLYGGVDASTPVGVDFSGFKTPQVVTNTNTAVMNLGATVNLDTAVPAITGGSTHPSLGLELDFGLDVPLTALIGGETVDVTDRDVTGKVTMDLSAADEVTFEGSVIANALTSLVFVHGTVPGQRVMIYMPHVQLANMADDDLNGRLLKSFDLIALPSPTGNDEVRIVVF